MRQPIATGLSGMMETRVPGAADLNAIVASLSSNSA
jgi:hypothetical protein